jgi:hypothetical protein
MYSIPDPTLSLTQSTSYGKALRLDVSVNTTKVRLMRHVCTRRPLRGDGAVGALGARAVVPQGTAVQVERMKPMLKAPGTKRLKL